MDHQSVLSTLQEWVDAIRKDDLDNVAWASEEVGRWKIDAASNKLIFKAIFNLSHTADRAKPTETRRGKQIFRITTSLCSCMTEMPDLLKFYEAIDRIVKKLIAMKFYAEAMEITRLCFPGQLVRGLESKHLDMYPKIANLWHDAGAELVDALIRDFDATKYKLVLEFLKNELSVLEVIAEDRTSHVLIRTLKYLTKLDGIGVDLRLEGDNNHRNIAKSFFDRIKVAPRGEEKYDAYREALKFLNLSTVIMKDRWKKLFLVFTESYEILKPIFAKDEELDSCFSMYKNMGTMIFRIDWGYSSKTSHWNIKRIRKETIVILAKFTERKAVLWNMKFIGDVLQPLLERWEDSIKKIHCQCHHTESFPEIISLIALMCLVLNSIRTRKCETCTTGDCTLRKYVYTVTIVSTKCLQLVTLTEQCSLVCATKFLDQVEELLEENAAAILEMKKANCPMWSTLWSYWGGKVRKLSSALSRRRRKKEAVCLYSFLASRIVEFEGLNTTKSKIKKNVLPDVLYGLSSAYYNMGKDREALTPCALGGLLSCQSHDDNIFRLWGFIKSACSHSASILELTMVGCLKEDMESIKKIGNVNLDDYDLKELCIQEIRGLHDAKGNLQVAIGATLIALQDLSCTTLQYAQGVQMLGYHLLKHEFDENFSSHLNRAKRKMGEEKCQTDSHRLTNASLDFYTFVLDLKDVSYKNKIEREEAKFAVCAPKPVDIEGRPPKTYCIVLAYRKIKVTEDSKLFANLQLAVDKWSVCIDHNICAPNDWHSLLTLHELVRAAEFSRLHRSSTLENRTWNLAYELSRQLKDSCTRIYVAGCSMLAHSVDAELVDTGKDLMIELANSTDADTNIAVSFFKVSLSSLYFDIGKHEEAVALLLQVIDLPRTDDFDNATHVTGILHNYCFLNHEEGTDYVIFLARCLYAIAALMDYAPSSRVGVNSLFSLTEITSQLLHRLIISRDAEATSHPAECLKHVIDLQHIQLEDWMVKLQDKRFILEDWYSDTKYRVLDPDVTNIIEIAKDVVHRIDSPKTSRQRTKGSRNDKTSKSAPREKLEPFSEADNESDSDDCKLVDEVNLKDKETNGRKRRYQTRVLTAPSPAMEIVASDSDIVPTSNHEEVESELSKKPKALLRIKKSTTADKKETGTRKKRQTTRSKMDN